MALLTMASRSLNRVTLIGNLTRDPELKYTPAGTAVCSFGVATNRSWTTADGQTKDEAQYHKIVAWQKLAELCGKLLTKGRKVYIEGRLTYRTFTGKDNIQRSVTEIILDDFILFSDGRRVMTDTTTASILPNNEKVQEEKTIKEKKGEKEEKTEESTESADESVNPDDIPF